MQQLANFIVDHDPMMVIRRTHDTVRYIRWAWNKDHADPIDEEELRLFLCDEHYGDLTDEQKTVARRCRDGMRSVYAELCVRLLQSEIMLEQGLLDEIRSLLTSGVPETATSLQAIGYKEFFPYFEGTADLESCLAHLKQASRNYAKRQLTWFRRQTDAVWLYLEDGNLEQQAAEQTEAFLAENNA